jgi:hypothetical protein
MTNGAKPLTMTDLVNESERAKQLWFREYMNMGRFSTCYMRESNILMDAAHHTLNLLADGSMAPAKLALKDAISKANALRLESVQPTPAPKDVRKAFLWIAEKEGMSLLANSEGVFTSARTQQAWDMFQRGAVWAEKRMQQPEPVEQPAKKRWLA